MKTQEPSSHRGTVYNHDGNDLPNQPGWYWWRKSKADRWTIVEVLDVYAYKLNDVTEYTVGELRGQWQRCIRPDEGQECFAVRAPSGHFIGTGTQQCCESRANSLNESDMFLDGQEYDVVPVTIVRRQQLAKEIKGE